MGSEPTFSSVTYEVDKELYDKIFKYIDIEYQYGTSGQLVSADYSVRTPDFWFGGTKSAFAERDILEKLVKVTQQEVISKRFYSSSEATKNAVAKYAKGQYDVSGFGHVKMSKSKNKAGFTMIFVI